MPPRRRLRGDAVPCGRRSTRPRPCGGPAAEGPGAPRCPTSATGGWPGRRPRQAGPARGRGRASRVTGMLPPPPQVGGERSEAELRCGRRCDTLLMPAMESVASYIGDPCTRAAVRVTGLTYPMTTPPSPPFRPARPGRSPMSWPTSTEWTSDILDGTWTERAPPDGPTTRCAASPRSGLHGLLERWNESGPRGRVTGRRLPGPRPPPSSSSTPVPMSTTSAPPSVDRAPVTPTACWWRCASSSTRLGAWSPSGSLPGIDPPSRRASGSSSVGDRPGPCGSPPPPSSSFRSFAGRRSIDQFLALPWQGDPSAVPHLLRRTARWPRRRCPGRVADTRSGAAAAHPGVGSATDGLRPASRPSTRRWTARPGTGWAWWGCPWAAGA